MAGPGPDHRTVLVTGATDGLGRALALELARGGAEVLIHGRDDARGSATLDAIRAETGNDRLHWLRADFASLREVHALAERVLAGHDRLDVLVNNAGLGAEPERRVSADGHELVLQVDYLAPYVLTRRLGPLLARSAPARIVNVASAGQAPLNFDDVMLEHGYSGAQAYTQAKLGDVMLTFDTAEELRDAGVTANALHPATYMPTKMVLGRGIAPYSELDDGVGATLRLVTDPDLEGVTGRYFNGLHEARAHAQAYDPGARARLRELAAELTGV